MINLSIEFKNYIMANKILVYPNFIYGWKNKLKKQTNKQSLPELNWASSLKTANKTKIVPQKISLKTVVKRSFYKSQVKRSFYKSQNEKNKIDKIMKRKFW